MSAKKVTSGKSSAKKASTKRSGPSYPGEDFEIRKRKRSKRSSKAAKKSRK
ncbi:MAG TPA: hypothetical protein VGQ36_23860 [Thermoanaerobaculia bacterium]|jgi:hypothetical protein|nr:hypothetical protein [Thermoanaerobaculia bacterium]